MRAEFRKQLQDYSGHAEQSRQDRELLLSGLDELQADEETAGQLEREYEELFAAEAQDFLVQTVPESADAGRRQAHGEIYQIQREKQEVMARLRRDLAEIRSPTDEKNVVEDTGRTTVFYNPNKGGYYITRKKGGREVLSAGDLMNHLEWYGAEDLKLDPKSVPKGMRKKFALEKAKIELQVLLDQQIILDELSRTETHEFKKHAYESVRDLEGRELTPGLITEKMVENVLRKLTVDLDLDISIDRADIYQDVEEKIDFILRVKERKRAAMVEDVDGLSGVETEVHKVGVQFTTNLSEEAATKKSRQIERAKKALQGSGIEDIVLVRMSRHDAMQIYDQWKQGQHPGGPEKLMNARMVEKIFRGVMNGLLDGEELDRRCQEIHDLLGNESDETKLHQLRRELGHS